MNVAPEALRVVRFLPSWLDNTPGVIDAAILDAEGQLLEFLREDGALVRNAATIAAALAVGASLTETLGGRCHVLQLTTQNGHVLACRAPNEFTLLVSADRTADLRLLSMDLAWDLRTRFSGAAEVPENGPTVVPLRPPA